MTSFLLLLALPSLAAAPVRLAAPAAASAARVAPIAAAAPATPAALTPKASLSAAGVAAASPKPAEQASALAAVYDASGPRARGDSAAVAAAAADGPRLPKGASALPSPDPGVPAAAPLRRPRKSKLRAFWENAAAPLKLLTNRPSNDRDWEPDLKVLPFAEIDGENVTVRNVRNFEYRTTRAFTAGYYDKSFKVADVESVWYGVEPFGKENGPAHTFLSFGFKDGTYLAVSVEIRRKKGDRFSSWKGLWNEYELAYVIADERDVIGLRTNHRKSDVYLYKAVTKNAESAGKILLDALKRANKLKDKPEFYNSLLNTCTTAILKHVNAAAPKRVPWGLDVALPARLEKRAYDLGFLDRSKPYERLRDDALITAKAQAAGAAADFSKRIRER